MSMNPRETTEKIREDYQNYIASILTVKDKQITKLAHEAVRNTEFLKGPYLETTLPFVDGKSLKDLADEKLISSEFGKMGKGVHFDDWKLRIHQEKALRHIIEDERNMVVSTGTGSGKTECYLYPIFNSLMREKEAGTLDSGVRALLIFPMNALANDQQKKLRKLLKEYPDITFGRYTGETEKKRAKETPEEAEKRLHEEYDLAHGSDTEEAYRKSIPNELMCREMMAEQPPHILLTNYAMLEFMLLRPDTAPFFDNQTAKNWRFIVIDEAHTYKGATGTEIAYLLRRVKERIRHNMKGEFRCIATSATLGNEGGRITAYSEKEPDVCCDNSDPERIVTVYNLKYAGKNNESNCCPCCGATQKGLIKRFLTANQPATFAIAKSLYDAIPPRPVVHAESEIIGDDIFIDDFFDDPVSDGESSIPEAMADESGRKLLIFSDNRQEAAFFAGFFEKKYNLIMWRKLILLCLQEAEGKSLSVPDLIKKVRNAAEKTGIYAFDQERNANMTDNQKFELASLYVMQEFMTPDIQTGLEGQGYIQIAPETMNIQENAELAGLRGKDVWNLLRFLMDTLRQKGAISYPEGIYATNDFFAPRNHKGYFRQAVTNIEHGEYVYGFMPEEGRINKRYALMIKLLNEEDEEKKNKLARENLAAAYNLLLKLINRKYIISTVDSSKGTVYLLNYAKWNFHYVDGNDMLYRCDKCGKTFGYSIKGICPEMKCDGNLRAVKACELQDEPYYKNLYADKKIIPMVSREHTAQLSAKTAGEYQKNFEQGIINVLSCSTTFEMGVDVGELEATFQRNVPPETANYIQRAGRAGRRTSSAAFSVTFSRRSSHDMTFFQDPTQIIAGKISPPVLEIDNEKIAERHLNSVVVAWFFKKHPEFFLERTKKIISYNEPENMMTTLRKELSAHPLELLTCIHKIIPEDICQSLRVDEWAFIDDLTGAEGSLTRAIDERIADVDGLKSFANEIYAKQDAATKGERYRANAALNVAETLETESSISFLSAKGVLPKYGFPIDTVSLDIIGGSDEEAKKIELSRDLKMAISEFAPPAKVVANGKIWESYSINTVPNKGWPAYIYHECPRCKKVYHPEGNVVDITTNLKDAPKKVCEFCNTLTDARLFIIPIFGFSTQMEYKPKPVGEARPSTYYATQTQFWGIEGLTEKQKAEAAERTVSFKGKDAKITYSPGGKLFVLNQGVDRRGLYICPSCGYAKDPSTKGFKHETRYRKTCGNNSFIKASLGNEFSTDILKISLPNLDKYLPDIEGTDDKDLYLSVLYAILEGASKALDISRSDISGCVTDKRELVLFDDTAGGSGFVKSIYRNFYDVILAAKNKVSGQCGCTKETSCYGCLRNYSNQYFHDQLSRGLAESYLDCLLNYEMDKNPVKLEIEREEQVEETIGTKSFDFEMPDTSSYPDVKTQLISLRDSAEDENVKHGYNKLIEAITDRNLEKCVSEERLPTKEKDVWPELFWAHSHVALFTPEARKQYDILKKYDWYCYIVDESINAETVISHIKEAK